MRKPELLLALLLLVAIVLTPACRGPRCLSPWASAFAGTSVSSFVLQGAIHDFLQQLVGCRASLVT
jgi:hypothetical protein